MNIINFEKLKHTLRSKVFLPHSDQKLRIKSEVYLQISFRVIIINANATRWITYASCLDLPSPRAPNAQAQKEEKKNC